MVDAPFLPEMLAAVSHHFLHILDEIPDIGTRPLQSSRAKSAYIRNHYYSIPGETSQLGGWAGVRWPGQAVGLRRMQSGLGIGIPTPWFVSPGKGKYNSDADDEGGYGGRPLTPSMRVYSAMTQPSRPSSQLRWFQRPISFSLVSELQGPMGQTNFFSTTSTKPRWRRMLGMVRSNNGH